MHSGPDAFQSTPAFLTGGGELGGLFRAADWSTSPLGMPAH